MQIATGRRYSGHSQTDLIHSVVSSVNLASVTLQSTIAEKLYLVSFHLENGKIKLIKIKISRDKKGSYEEGLQ